MSEPLDKKALEAAIAASDNVQECDCDYGNPERCFYHLQLPEQKECCIKAAICGYLNALEGITQQAGEARPDAGPGNVNAESQTHTPSPAVSPSPPPGGLREAAQAFVTDYHERQGVKSFWVPTHHFIAGVHQSDCKFCALEAALASSPVAPEEKV